MDVVNGTGMRPDNMTSRFGRLALIALSAATLAGCESARFGGPGPTRLANARPAPAYTAPEPVIEALPSGSVTSEPLAPPPGASGPPPATGTLGPGPVVADVPTLSGSPRPIETLAPPSASSSPPASGGGRSASIGGWTARDASGASCRVNLSGSPALDLYRASAPGCPNKDLAKVTAWDFRDGEVYLYQPGGAVAARLRSSDGSLSGVLAKSGAPLTLVR